MILLLAALGCGLIWGRAVAGWVILVWAILKFVFHMAEAVQR